MEKPSESGVGKGLKIPKKNKKIKMKIIKKVHYFSIGLYEGYDFIVIMVKTAIDGTVQWRI